MRIRTLALVTGISLLGAGAQVDAGTAPQIVGDRVAGIFLQHGVHQLDGLGKVTGLVRALGLRLLLLVFGVRVGAKRLLLLSAEQLGIGRLRQSERAGYTDCPRGKLDEIALTACQKFVRALRSLPWSPLPCAHNSTRVATWKIASRRLGRLVDASAKCRILGTEGGVCQACGGDVGGR